MTLEKGFGRSRERSSAGLAAVRMWLCARTTPSFYASELYREAR